MNPITIEVKRTPTTVTVNGQVMSVQQLSVLLPFARKPADLSEACEASGSDTVYITETREMTPDEFDAFSRSLLRSRDWLSGKGGYANDGRLCVEVHAPGRPWLYVDPSGGDYGRYVARIG
jgi:hypothetical protein